LAASDVVAAQYQIGDQASKLKFAVMHSKVFKDLKNAGAITFQTAANILPLASQTATLGLELGSLVPTLEGMIVKISDYATVVSGSPTQYVTYLLGVGSMGLFYQRAPKIEEGREALIDGGYDYVVPRMDFVMLTHGTNYTSTSYSDTNISDTANYVLKWNQKQVHAVRIISN
jgi:hypothetical protein